MADVRLMQKALEESSRLSRYARLGLWAFPVFAVLLFAGSITHQPPPQTQIADWSRFVTTNDFLIQ